MRFLFLILISTSTLSKLPSGIFERDLDYKLNIKELKKGNFHYFYSLLKSEKNSFKNLTIDQKDIDTSKIADFFLPLDTKNLWDPSEKNYLAVAKYSFIAPIDIKEIDESYFSGQKYLQQTLPKYKVTKKADHYHIGGSVFTPDFKAYIQFLSYHHPYTKLLEIIDTKKMQQGKMKVSFMHQDSFGRVMFFKTAKMATAIIIYEEFDKKNTLVTQFILSNIINVPTKSLIKESMLENLQNVVYGTREAARKGFK